MAKIDATQDEIDSTLAGYSKDYAAAKAQNNVDGMIKANEDAIQYRIDTGLITENEADNYRAKEDIGNEQAKVAAVEATMTPYNDSESTGDYSDYLSDIYSSQTEANLAALEEAYQNNLAELDAAAEDIAPYYESSRNQTAATSEQEKRNFAEYANANGLNSGTGGQAELARSVTLQGDLNTLNQAEADAYSDLELQRTQLTNEYNAAIASAKADGNYQLANALYQEKVRVDEELQQNEQFDQQMAYQYAGLAQNQSQFDQSFGLEQDEFDYSKLSDKEEQQREDALLNAQIKASDGDYSGYYEYLTIYGMDGMSNIDVAALNAFFKKQYS